MEFDCQHVISVSLEKISSERRRRNGANLHRSLMICDLLVKLRSHVLAQEDSEMRPTTAASATTQTVESDDKLLNSSASLHDQNETEDEKENRPSPSVSSKLYQDELSQMATSMCENVLDESGSISTEDATYGTYQCSVSQPSETYIRTHCDADSINVNVCQSLSLAQPQPLATIEHNQMENVNLNVNANTNTNMFTQTDTNRLVGVSSRDQIGAQQRAVLIPVSAALRDREQRRNKRRYYSTSKTTGDDAEASECDKRCRLVPESNFERESQVAENEADVQAEMLQNVANLNGYIALPITLLDANGLNAISYGLNGYVLSGSVLFAYPAQMCSPLKSPINSVAAAQNLQSDSVANDSNLPLVIVIN